MDEAEARRVAEIIAELRRLRANSSGDDTYRYYSGAVSSLLSVLKQLNPAIAEQVRRDA